jgi:hypothetical protein
MENPLRSWRLVDWLTASGVVIGLISLAKGWHWQESVSDAWNNLNPWRLIFWIVTLALMGRLYFYLLEKLNEEIQRLKNDAAEKDKATEKKLTIEIENRVKQVSDRLGPLSNSVERLKGEAEVTQKRYQDLAERCAELGTRLKRDHPNPQS